MFDNLLSEDERLFRGAVREFAEREVTPRALEWDRAGRYPVELLRELGRLGWLGCGFPAELGGSGGGAVHLGLMFAELSRASAGFALGVYAHSALASAAIYRLGNEQQRLELLPAALSGERIGCWAYAEPGAGADVTTVATRARREGDEYVLEGAKLYVTNAPFADFTVLVARAADGSGLEGIAVFCVDNDTPGLALGQRLDKLGMAPAETAELVLDGCRIPASRRLGPERTGFIEALKVLTLGRIAAATLAVGLGRAALDAAIDYAGARQQFGGPLTRKQFVRFTLAEIASRIEGSAQLAFAAARLADQGHPHATEASVAKLQATEACSWACERALHLCGAQGYMTESPAQRYYRDCKVLELGEGTSEIQRELIARDLGL